MMITDPLYQSKMYSYEYFIFLIYAIDLTFQILVHITFLYEVSPKFYIILNRDTCGIFHH